MVSTLGYNSHLALTLVWKFWLSAIAVNGIRNPFQYQPWRTKKTFEAMFDILEADIIVFQETKIQRKDLRDDMVLVQGWDCYWSLPRHKKGAKAMMIMTCFRKMSDTR